MAKKRNVEQQRKEPVQSVGFAKENIDKVNKVPLRGITFDEQQIINHYGIFEPYGTMYPVIIRYIADTDPITQIILNLRSTQVREYGELNTSGNDEIPGWCVRMVDRDKHPDKTDLAKIRYLNDFFQHCGVKYNPDKDIDNISDMMSVMTTERLILDRLAFGLRYDSKGKLYDFNLYDGGTIKKVVPEGFQGNKKDFDASIYYYLWSTADRAESEKRRIAGMTDDMTKIKYIQKIDDRIVAGFESHELLLGINNFNLSVRRYGEGKSPVERAMQSIGSFIKSFKYNADVFDEGTIPKIALSLEAGGYNPQSIRQFQREFRANFQGGAQRDKNIPIINGKANILDLGNKSRDMEYIQYLGFGASLIFAAFGVDPMEIGLKFDHSQSMFTENQDARQKNSKSRSLQEELKSNARMFNRALKINGVMDYEFHYTGLEVKDQGAYQDLLQKMVTNNSTLNEVRALQDKPSLGKNGDIVLNPVYLQYLQQVQQQSQQGGEMPDNTDIDDMVDEAADEMYKAQIKKKIYLM